VRFNKPINPLTVDGATILVTDGTNPAVPCTISFSNGNRDVLIAPHTPLKDGTLMTLTVSGVEDLAGNAVVAQTTQFTTRTGPDLVPPVVIGENPFNGATNVPVNTPIILQVNKPIDPSTVNSNSFFVNDNVVGQVAGNYTVSGDGRTITFMPNAPLAISRSHSVFFVNQGITDVTGNLLVNSPSFSNFSFTTSTVADTIAPNVLGVSPADTLTGVPINAQVMVQFDKAIQTLSASAVTLSAGGTAVDVIAQFSNGNRTLSLIPVVPLRASTVHRVTIGTGVKDLSGNALAAMVSTTFTTGTGADLIGPAVSLVDPGNGATGVPRNAVMRLGFSKRINPLTVNNATFLVFPQSTGIPIAGTIAVAADGRSASFMPTSALAALTAYFVQAFGITDLAGQDGINLFTRFTTGAS
jgi:hypothetical protein